MVVINADDFGRSQSINKAIVLAFRDKIINQTTIMVNMLYVDDAVVLSRENEFFDCVGLHINLDDGAPLTSNIKQCNIFCDDKGEFNGNFRKNRLKLFHLNKFERQCCEEEIEAQMDKYISFGFTKMHIDSHHHIHVLPSILPLVISIAKKKGFQSMRLRFNLQSSNYFKKIFTGIINYFISRHFRTTDYFCDSTYYLQKKPSLSSLEVMCHPDIYEDKMIDVIGKRENCHFEDLYKLSV